MHASIPNVTRFIKENNEMKRYVCEVCGWLYEEADGCAEQNVAPKTEWKDVPGDFVCPLCGAGKESFSEE